MNNKKSMIISYYNNKKDLSLPWKIKNLLKLEGEILFPQGFILTDQKDIWQEVFIYYEKYISSPFYICRSAMIYEDGEVLSYAWLFESIEWKYNENNLLEDIKEVFLSLNNEFIDEYEKNCLWFILENRKMNVLVQEFIIWEVSWVYFSEYSWGRLIEYVKWCNQFLVEWIVNTNKIFLDKEYRLEKHIKNNQYKYIGENLDIFIYDRINQSLSDFMMEELFFTFKKLERFFDFPLDVEWTIRWGKVYILQVRPLIEK